MCICAKGAEKKHQNNTRKRRIEGGREKERNREARGRVNYVTSRRRAARSRLNKGRFFSLGSPRLVEGRFRSTNRRDSSSGIFGAARAPRAHTKRSVT